LTLLALLTAAATVPFASASAESVEEFYRGKTIRVIVPTGPGGTYALFGNFINEAMSRHIPGNPKLVMQFMPSGIQATNYLFNVPVKDGLTIGMLSQTSGIIQVMTPEHVKYDLRQFAALGLFAQLNAVMTVSERTTIKSVEDLKKTPVSLGATDTSSYQYVIPTMMNRYLGTKNKVVTGYKGIAETTLAPLTAALRDWSRTIPGLQRGLLGPDDVDRITARVEHQLLFHRDLQVHLEVHPVVLHRHVVHTGQRPQLEGNVDEIGRDGGAGRGVHAARGVRGAQPAAG
jgi:hypothetical protein